MKIQIDLTAKTIKLESNVNFGEFVTKIQEMLSDWKDYKIETNTIINWREYPVWIYKPYDRNPWWYRTTGSTGVGTTLTTSGSVGINALSIKNDSLSETTNGYTASDEIQTILKRWKKDYEEKYSNANILNVEI